MLLLSNNFIEIGETNMSLLTPSGSLNKTTLSPNHANQQAQTNANIAKDITPPKCFGTDYFGKWNMTGMTFDSMRIDHPEYQVKCGNCPFFEKCYLCNHIRLLRIKR